MIRQFRFLLGISAFFLIQLSTTALAGGTWIPTSDINFKRSRNAVAYDAVTGHFFLVGGESPTLSRDIPIEEFDPVTEQWTIREKLSIGVSNTGAVFMDGYLYVPGGYTAGGSVANMQRYNPATGTTLQLAPMPVAIHAHAITKHAGKIHVFGGSPNGDAGTAHYAYDVATGVWSTLAPLPIGVYYATAVTVGEYSYVIGGGTDDLAITQVYSHDFNGWLSGPALQVGRGGAGAFVDSLNQIHVVGGGWASYLATTEVLQGANWVASSPLVAGARTFGVAYGNGIAVKAGGWSAGFLNAAEIFLDMGNLIFADGFE